MSENACPHRSKRFRPAIDVHYAKLLDGQPAFIRRKRSRGKYAVGIKYEREVHDRLSLLALGKPHLEYYEGPWIEFGDRDGRRWCQPDALLVDRRQRVAIIAEIKLKHTQDAWWQLVHLYRPVVSALFPQVRPICLVEIVHWYDNECVWPERFDFTDSPLRIPHANKVAVCIFNPKRGGSFLKDELASPGHHGREGGRETPGPIGHEEGAVGPAGVTR